MTQRTLERLTRLWQKRLRLQDWQIKVELKPADEMIERDLYGHSIHRPAEWEALIEIADDAEEAEKTLVHELLHLRLAPFTGILRELPFKLNKEDQASQETSINLLASCFVAAYGESRGKK